MLFVSINVNEPALFVLGGFDMVIEDIVAFNVTVNTFPFAKSNVNPPPEIDGLEYFSS